MEEDLEEDLEEEYHDTILIEFYHDMDVDTSSLDSSDSDT